MRILFVCFADSVHSQSWVRLFDDLEDNARVFAGPFFVGGMYPPIPWTRTTYVLTEPEPERETAKTIFWFPRYRIVDIVSRRFIYRFSLEKKFLRKVVQNWQPDIVHALSLTPAGAFAWESLSELPDQKRPKFVVSSWGSDIHLGKDDPKQKPTLQGILKNCDGFIGDCYRDIRSAKLLGLKSGAAFEIPIPVNGGMETRIPPQTRTVGKRNVILIPKGYEGFANKTLPILEALELLGDKLWNYEIHLLMASDEVRRHLSNLSQSLQTRCQCYQHVRPEVVAQLMDRSRTMIATSLSDGTPNSLLEAMQAGALPIASPLESIREWVTDGENGLLVNALRPDEIAKAVERAITDDDLVQRAAKINFDIIQKRANRDLIRKQVMEFYQRVCG